MDTFLIDGCPLHRPADAYLPYDGIEDVGEAVPACKGSPMSLAVLARHGRTFRLAGRLLPQAILASAAELYAFWRAVDDLADETPDRDAARDEFVALRRELLAGTRAHPLAAQFARLHLGTGASREAAVALINTVLKDLDPVRLPDEPALLQYAYGAAGTVGSMMCTVLGAGLAGLSLAVRLAYPRFGSLRVLVVEPRTRYRRDRTWSYWTLRPHPFHEAVSHHWDQWTVATPGREIVLKARGLRYESIQADAFYNLALGRIRSAPHIELCLGHAAEATEEDGTVVLRVAGTVVRAAMAFDTRPPAGIGRHGLAQVFLGQEIETEQPVFDPGTAMLMDFRCAQAGAAHFTYVLPSTTRRALVEDTWFTPNGLRPPDHRGAIRDYMAARGVDRFRVLFEEQGALPMDPVFQPRLGKRLQPLGTAGGATRPSTGYAFNAIQARCDQIVADLDTGCLPRPAKPRPGLVRFMDHVLLGLLEQRPELAPRVFHALFAGSPPRSLVRFLNDTAGLADFAAVAAAIPFWPTMGAAGRLAAGRLEWPRAAPG